MKLYDQVKELLTKYPPLRDSDRLLIWNVFGVSGYLNTQGFPDSSFIMKLDFMKAPNMESIRRCRQKIQEQCPELRSSKEVQKLKDEKEKSKSTFVYRETI